jgi:cold shock CspA family protein/ribosome-associated translation inhibitor RaiA
MKVPVEITYRDVTKTDDIEELIREKASKLERVCNYMSSCRVAVERPVQRHQDGNPYRVRIDVTVPPSKEIVASRESPAGSKPEDLPTTIRSAFDAVRRQLLELVEKQRGELKSHPEQDIGGVVIRIAKEAGYGFLKTTEGQELYFHQNSVLNGDFDRLEIGTGVQFTEEDGQEGPQASTVRIVDKPGARVDKSGEEFEETPLGWGKK